MARNPARVIAELEAVYARLPKIACAGKCQGACGPIPMTDAERRRIEGVLGEPLTASPTTLSCCALGVNGECRAYAARPLVCRLYGVTPGLCCEFGCRPERLLTVAEGIAITEEVERIGGAGMHEFSIGGELVSTKMADVIRAAVGVLVDAGGSNVRRT